MMIDGSPLSIEQVAGVARGGFRVQLAESARPAIEAAREVVARGVAGSEAIYGVNTGFGSLSRVRISPDEVREVQRNLIRSHAAGVGEPLDEEVVRAMLVILAGSLARGCSGVRVALIERGGAIARVGWRFGRSCAPFARGPGADRRRPCYARSRGGDRR